MDQRTRRLLEQTLEQILPVEQEAGSRFYGRLFDTSPELLALFRRNLSLPELAPAAARRFVQLLTITIAAARDEMVGDVQGARSVHGLAERHVGYRVAPEDYVPLGEALLWTLQRQLGDSFTSEARTAWSVAYDRLADRMIDVFMSAAA